MDPETFGPYQLLELVGRGGMGEVYRAVDTRRGRTVALKRLLPALAADDDFAARFRRESALAARLSDPHIVPIHDFGTIDGQLYLDMRFVEGRDLGDVLRDDGPLQPEHAVVVIEQLAEALDAAHADGLVHRDVKPSNALVTASGFVYLVDFGIARDADDATAVTAAGATVGTIDYMAPERFEEGPIDRRVDVYSLACVLHQLLVGQKPFPVTGFVAMMAAHLNKQPPRPSTLRPGVPAAFDEVVARGMAKDREQRYPTTGALAAAARAALAPVVETRFITPRQPTPRFAPPPAGPPQYAGSPPGAAQQYAGAPQPGQATPFAAQPPGSGRPYGAARQYGSPPSQAPDQPRRGGWASRATLLTGATMLVILGALVAALIVVPRVTAGTTTPIATTSPTTSSGPVPTTPPAPAGPVTVALPQPSGIAVTPDGRTAYAVAERSTAVVDLTAGGVTRTLPVGGYAVAVTPDGKKVVIVDRDEGVLHVLAPDGAPLGDVDIGRQGGGFGLSPDGATAYVATLSTVVAVDLATRAITGRADLGNAPYSATAGNGYVYATWVQLADTGDGALVTIDPRTMQETERVGLSPWVVSLAMAGSRVLVEARDAMWVVTPGNGGAVRVPGVVPIRVAASADGRRGYAVTDGALAIVDPATATVVDTVPVPGAAGAPVPGNPGALAITPDGRAVVGTTSGVTIVPAR